MESLGPYRRLKSRIAAFDRWWWAGPAELHALSGSEFYEDVSPAELASLREAAPS